LGRFTQDCLYSQHLGLHSNVGIPANHLPGHVATHSTDRGKRSNEKVKASRKCTFGVNSCLAHDLDTYFRKFSGVLGGQTPGDLDHKCLCSFQQVRAAPIRGTVHLLL
jgi:hypothetical protein